MYLWPRKYIEKVTDSATLFTESVLLVSLFYQKFVVKLLNQAIKIALKSKSIH